MDVGLYHSRKRSSFTAHQRAFARRLANISTPPVPRKDICNVPVQQVPDNYQLESCEQDILREIESVIGARTVSESQLEFIPHWLLSKAIEDEKKNYEDAYEELEMKDVPKAAKIISKTQIRTRTLSVRTPPLLNSRPLGLLSH